MKRPPFVRTPSSLAVDFFTLPGAQLLETFGQILAASSCVQSVCALPFCIPIMPLQVPLSLKCHCCSPFILLATRQQHLRLIHLCSATVGRQGHLSSTLEEPERRAWRLHTPVWLVSLSPHASGLPCLHVTAMGQGTGKSAQPSEMSNMG